MKRKDQVILWALVGVAYWLGTRTARRRGPIEVPALPPAQESMPPSGGDPGLGEWDALAFDVDVFPDGADLRTLRPPGTRDGVSVAPECEAIAVGHAFWFKLNAMAKPLIDQGQSAEGAWDELRYVLFPGIAVSGAGPIHAFHACLADEAEAALLVEEEILDRLRVLNGPSLTGALTRNPCIDPPLPTMGDAVVHALRGLRR